MTNKKEVAKARKIKEVIPQIITRKVGATTYKVAMHFSNTSKENMDDKLLRIIKHDSTNSK